MNFKPAFLALTLSAALATAIGCQPTSGEIQPAPVAAVPAAPIPENPIFAHLVAGELDATALPEGFSLNTLKPEPLRTLSLRYGGVGKVTLQLDGPFASQLISYTVYEADSGATQAFSHIADLPPDRNQYKAEPLSPPGFDSELYAESSFERYEGGKTEIVRTTVATRAASSVVLSQIIVKGKDRNPDAEAAAVALLRSAIQHLQAAGSSTAAPAAEDSAATNGPTTEGHDDGATD